MTELIRFRFNNLLYIGKINSIGKVWQDLIENITIENIDVKDSNCTIYTTENDTITIDMNQLNGLGAKAIKFCFDNSLLIDNNIEILKRMDRVLNNFGNKEDNLEFLIINTNMCIHFLIHALNVSKEDCEQCIVNIINKRCSFNSTKDDSRKNICQFDFKKDCSLFNKKDKDVEKTVSLYFDVLKKYYYGYSFISLSDQINL